MNKIKLLGLSLFTLLFVTFSSCTKEDEVSEKSGATAEITVKYKGKIQTDYPVDMFRNKKGPSSGFFTEFYADKTVVTNEYGIAVFKLQDVYDLEIINNQTTLYFAVFSEQGDAYTAITIEKGETKSATINIE